MTLEELIKKDGIEALQSKLQEIVSNKVDNDKVEFTLEDGGDEISFVSSFPEDEDRYIVAHMNYDEELDDNDCLNSIINYVAGCYWEDYCDVGDEFDSHQTNCVMKLNNK